MARRARLQSLAVALICLGCGGRGGRPPEKPPTLRGPDGREYHLLERGPYKAYYDAWGRLQRIDYDADGDGRPDHIAHHDGARTPRLIEVDEDRDGLVDRWESYEQGRLVKVGLSRRGGAPDVWLFPQPDGGQARREYDEDGDGRVDR